MEKILVLGAGTGGLVAANLLASHGYKVTLIERSDTHLFQPGMLWIAFQGHSPSRYTRPVKDLVRPGVELVKGSVAGIDLGDRLVYLADGRIFTYTTLIIALGAQLDYEAVPGHRELVERYGDFYSGAQAAARMWSHLRELVRGRLVIAAADPLYKCPPAPHKAAFLAAHTLRRMGRLDSVEVHLALPFLHEYPSEVVARIVAPKLEEAGVNVSTLFTVESIDVDKGRIYSLEGEEIDFSLAAVIPVHRGPSVKVEPGEVLDEDGFVKVDRYKLNVEGYDDAYAIGDASNAPTSKTGVTAHLGAEVVVDRIMGLDSRFNGRTNCPIVANGEASFVISSYDYPPVPVKFSRFKRMLEDLFIASYWSSLKYPERWAPIFRAYFNATDPRVISGGW
ncbi:MAG: FAD-dependent oxidoreductase [Desulfurococcales archaeon]|nr:FAD-dependent oxidoreductase [Desulfurococcales archaeon]MCE4605223.1 FAD-dependent oxidoreductase [Desulfurococcales archaeon]